MFRAPHPCSPHLHLMPRSCNSPHYKRQIQQRNSRICILDMCKHRSYSSTRHRYNTENRSTRSLQVLDLNGCSSLPVQDQRPEPSAKRLMQLVSFLISFICGIRQSEHSNQQSFDPASGLHLHGQFEISPRVNAAIGGLWTVYASMHNRVEAALLMYCFDIAFSPSLFLLDFGRLVMRMGVVMGSPVRFLISKNRIMLCLSFVKFLEYV